jgi:hypothetical protein
LELEHPPEVQDPAHGLVSVFVVVEDDDAEEQESALEPAGLEYRSEYQPPPFRTNDELEIRRSAFPPHTGHGT